MLRALVVLVLLATTSLVAADTGGSMGGGDWGDSGGGGGGGGDDGPSSYDHDSGSYSSSSDHRHDEDTGLVVLVLAVVGVIAFATFTYVDGMKPGASPVVSSRVVSPSFSWGFMDVGVLRIAVDGRARAFVQANLRRIATFADTKTAAGRLWMLSEVSLMLRRLRDAWVYGGAVNEPVRTKLAAKQVFDRHVDQARSRYRDETIRNASGVTTTAPAPAAVPRPEEGDGLILVSIILCARSELTEVLDVARGEDLRRALEAAPYRTAEDLVAVEIVWQPTEDADRLSSIELVAKYPSPELIPIAGALVGKVFCAYCSGPFPAELVSCPHCGAPARAAG